MEMGGWVTKTVKSEVRDVERMREDSSTSSGISVSSKNRTRKSGLEASEVELERA